MKRTVTLWMLLILTLLPLIDLLQPGIPLTHDGPDHVARIANFFQSLSEGNWVPRWAANLNWGYGHPILMFLYPLPSYLASIFHAFGFSLIDSTKLVFATAYLASILAMFIWAMAQWGTAAGLIAGLLYGFAPYRFVDMYVRGALGEHVAFVFPPLILYGLLLAAWEDSVSPRSSLIISLSTAGLVLSHNALSLIFFPIIIIYLVYLAYFVVVPRKQFMIVTFGALSLGIALAAFFWLPAFFEGKYTLRDIVTRGSVIDRFVSWSEFFMMPWSFGGSKELSKEVGWSQWFFALAGVWFLNKTKVRQIRWQLAALLMILLITLYLMTNWSLPIWNNLTILQKFQFPWRFLSLVVFITATIGAVVTVNLEQRYHTGLLIVTTGLILTTTWPMWRAKDYLNKSEDFFRGIYESTTDTGESSPIWSVRFMERRPTIPIEVIAGKAQIIQGPRNSTKHDYEIITAEHSRLVENTLYFPGWEVLVDNQPVEIEFQDPNFRGLITFEVDVGKHAVLVNFKETKFRRLANLISLFAVAVSIGLAVWLIKRKFYA